MYVWCRVWCPTGVSTWVLIFLIFCNNLHLHLTFLSCIQFADDTTIYISHHSLDFITFALEHNLNILQDWFLANKLTLNIGKSVAILFGKHNGKRLNVCIGKEKIPQLSCTKFLGLWIDENLSWREHTNKLLLKLNSNINLLKTGRNFLTSHALKVIYFAQIHSNLTYSIGVWGSLISKEILLKLQRIQTACLKIINIWGPNEILTVNQQVKLELCKLWHKWALGLLPSNLEQTMNTDHRDRSLKKTHLYNTRQKRLQNRPRST